MTDADCRELQEKWMGEPWHDITDTYPLDPPGSQHCDSCEEYITSKNLHLNCTFTTWRDFGDLWSWATKQEWFCEFVEKVTYLNDNTPDYDSNLFNLKLGLIEFIDPIRFPELTLEWLREREKEE